MLLILLALCVAVALAGLVATYAAHPDRRQRVPHALPATDELTELRDRTEP